MALVKNVTFGTRCVAAARRSGTKCGDVIGSLPSASVSVCACGQHGRGDRFERLHRQERGRTAHERLEAVVAHDAADVAAVRDVDLELHEPPVGWHQPGLGERGVERLQIGSRGETLGQPGHGAHDTTGAC